MLRRWLRPRYPTIVSWVVVPTSGVAPYVFTAVLKNKYLLDGVRYSLEVATSTATGTCQTDPNLGILQPALTAEVLATGSYTRSGSVAVGTCASSILRIRDVSTGLLTQSSFANINNV